MKDAVLITLEDTPQLAEFAARGVVEYIRKHPKATDAIIADMIQGAIDGYIMAKQDERSKSK